jgi:LysM repeat protein
MVKALIKSGISFGILMLGFVVVVSAQNTTHTVEKGETLFSIAQQYNVEVQQLREWNNLQGNEVSLGQSLIIKKTTPENATTHTVEPKETLFSISKQYNVSIPELKTWNNLANNNLEVGQQLTIYPSEASEQQQASIVVNNETQQNTYYTVKSGDTLYQIAQQHGMSVDEIKNLNDLSSNTISVGQRLTVRGGAAPPPSVAKSMESSPQGKFIVYEVSDGSISLQSLLNKFQMDEQELRALNPGVSENTFRSGQELTVLAPPSRRYKNPYRKSANLQNLGTTSVTKYSESERAKPTTNGELYNPDGLTAAHSNISLGSVIFIENSENQKGIYVRVNDRISGNGLKLSSAAWQALDIKNNLPTVTIYQDK